MEVRKEFSHDGDPCIHCHTPHDDVERGECPALLLIDGMAALKRHELVLAGQGNYYAADRIAEEIVLRGKKLAKLQSKAHNLLAESKNVSKYDALSQSCFGKPYSELDADDQITITDIWAERNE